MLLQQYDREELYRKVWEQNQPGLLILAADLASETTGPITSIRFVTMPLMGNRASFLTSSTLSTSVT